MNGDPFAEIRQALEALRDAPEPTGTGPQQIRRLHNRGQALATATLAILRIMRRNNERIDSAVGAISRLTAGRRRGE